MPRLNALAARTSNVPHKTCTLCWLLTNLETENPEIHETLLAALANPLARYTEISEALAELGHNVHHDTISRCARGRCGAARRLRNPAQ